MYWSLRSVSYILILRKFFIMFSKKRGFWTLCVGNHYMGGKYCFMGLWLGLLSVMYEKTLKLGVGKDVITKWSFIMFQNAKFWGVLINSLQIHSYSIAFVHIDLTCIKNNSLEVKSKFEHNAFQLKTYSAFWDISDLLG